MLLSNKCRAFSLLELLVSMLVLYIISAYIISLFSSGSRFGGRTREYSVSTFLARNQMERLSCSPLERLARQSSGKCEHPYEDYVWNASVSDFSGELKLLKLEVVSPMKARSSLLRLMRERSFFGVSCDEYGDQVIWSRPGQSAAGFVQSSAPSSSAKTVSLSMPEVDDCYIGAVSGVPGRGAAWAACTNRATVGFYGFDDKHRVIKRIKLNASTHSGFSSPLFTGIAADSWGNRVYCADVVNGAIWMAAEPADKNHLEWAGGSPWRPSAVPLCEPMGLALDENASILWIAEGPVRALRPLHLNADTAPYGQGAERLAGVGWWGGRCSPKLGSGAFSGVAVNAWSSLVYAADSGYLHVLTYSVDGALSLSSAWKSYRLPTDLCSALPSGLACDPYRNLVYINTRQGILWRAVLDSSGVSFELVQ
ncbi:hypothetical protein IJT17_03210 [bacterium]|nr:hypothetical protein [bacterium]